MNMRMHEKSWRCYHGDATNTVPFCFPDPRAIIKLICQISSMMKCGLVHYINYQFYPVSCEWISSCLTNLLALSAIIFSYCFGHFRAKVKACELLFPATAPLTEDKLYRVCLSFCYVGIILVLTSTGTTFTNPQLSYYFTQEATTDRLTGCPTLEDLGVELNPLEDAARYQLKVHKRGRYYAESLGEFAPAIPPPTASEVDESRKTYY